MAGFCMNYCLFISVAGVILLLFFSLCCFVNVEALHLPNGKNNQRGASVLIAALIYAGIVALILHKKKEEEELRVRNPYQAQNVPDEDLRARLMQDY